MSCTYLALTSPPRELAKPIIALFHRWTLPGFSLNLSVCKTKASSYTPILIANMRWIHIIENWEDSLFFLVAISYSSHFIQTPCWGSIISWEYNDRNSWIFDRLQELRWNGLSFLEGLVIDEGENTFSDEMIVKMISKIVAGVSTPKTDKHIVFIDTLRWRVVPVAAGIHHGPGDKIAEVFWTLKCSTASGRVAFTDWRGRSRIVERGTETY